MFDFSLAELVLAAVVALIVLGPERLPKVARTAGRWVAKIQNMAASVKTELAQQAEYVELVKVKQEFQQAAEEVRTEIHEAGSRLREDADAIRSEIDSIDAASFASKTGSAAALSETADELPAWERLPEQRTPADFGLDDNGVPLPPLLSGLQSKSLRKQAMARKRDLRPRHRPAPRLRSRR